MLSRAWAGAAIQNCSSPDFGGGSERNNVTPTTLLQSTVFNFFTFSFLQGHFNDFMPS
jgi:hypothetical protein